LPLNAVNSIKDAILLFSHGSVLCGAGETLRALAQRMRERGEAPIIEIGYLNYSLPLFAEAFENCVRQGATRITIAPYFLVEGKFVAVDLPPQIEKMTSRFPDVEVLVAQAMKHHPLLAHAILSSASRAAPPQAWRDIWKTAPQSCRDNPQCPLYGTPRCPATQAAL